MSWKCSSSKGSRGWSSEREVFKFLGDERRHDGG
jgi:hypothetical protein